MTFNKQIKEKNTYTKPRAISFHPLQTAKSPAQNRALLQLLSPDS